MINNQCDLNKCHLTMNKLWGREKTQYLMVAEIGKLRRMPRHFSRSINRELTLMWRSCSRLLRVRNNCWCCASASCSFLWRNSTLSPSSCTSWTSLKQVISLMVWQKLLQCKLNLISLTSRLFIWKRQNQLLSVYKIK